jgi:hypothetical protein
LLPNNRLACYIFDLKFIAGKNEDFSSMRFEHSFIMANLYFPNILKMNKKISVDFLQELLFDNFYSHFLIDLRKFNPIDYTIFSYLNSFGFLDALKKFMTMDFSFLTLNLILLVDGARTIGRNRLEGWLSDS